MRFNASQLPLDPKVTKVTFLEGGPSAGVRTPPSAAPSFFFLELIYLKRNFRNFKAERLRDAFYAIMTRNSMRNLSYGVTF